MPFHTVGIWLRYRLNIRMMFSKYMYKCLSIVTGPQLIQQASGREFFFTYVTFTLSNANLFQSKHKTWILGRIQRVWAASQTWLVPLEIVFSFLQGELNRRRERYMVSVHFAVTFLDCWRTRFCVTTITKAADLM